MPALAPPRFATDGDRLIVRLDLADVAAPAVSIPVTHAALEIHSPAGPLICSVALTGDVTADEVEATQHGNTLEISLPRYAVGNGARVRLARLVSVVVRRPLGVRPGWQAGSQAPT